jgi:hypothetical protein
MWRRERAILQNSLQRGAEMPVRVLICEMPRLLMDAVSAIIAEEPGMTIVERLGGAADVAASIRALQPDVVVLQEDGAPRLGNHAALFAARAGLRVVTLAGGGGGGALYRMGVRPASLRQPSAAQFVRAVRGSPLLQPAGSRRRRRPSR